MTKSKRGNYIDSITKQKIAPGVGHYDTIKAYDKTQKTRNSLFLPKRKHKTLTEDFVNSKKYVPGVGKYNTGDLFKKISKHSTVRKGRFG